MFLALGFWSILTVFLHLLKIMNLQCTFLYLSVVVHLSEIFNLCLFLHLYFCERRLLLFIKQVKTNEKWHWSLLFPLRVTSLPQRRHSQSLYSLMLFNAPRASLVFQRAHVFILDWLVNSKVRVLYMSCSLLCSQFQYSPTPQQRLNEQLMNELKGVGKIMAIWYSCPKHFKSTPYFFSQPCQSFSDFQFTNILAQTIRFSNALSVHLIIP